MAALRESSRMLRALLRNRTALSGTVQPCPSLQPPSQKCLSLQTPTCSELLSAISSLSISPHTTPMAARSLHTSRPSCGLMEFFDDKENWGETTVNTGRPYRLDELRIKSNEDLHKLWYVLLKERNMLLTMEAEYNRNCELLPNPERIAKVEESMENILEVVEERDEAVNLLETGKPSPHPRGGVVRDFLGRPVYRRFQEYAMPAHLNKVYRLLYPLGGLRKQHLKYLPLWREKLARHSWYKYHQQRKLNRKLLRRFPHLEGKLEEPEPPQEPRVS